MQLVQKMVQNQAKIVQLAPATNEKSLCLQQLCRSLGKKESGPSLNAAVPQNEAAHPPSPQRRLVLVQRMPPAKAVAAITARLLPSKRFYSLI